MSSEKPYYSSGYIKEVTKKASDILRARNAYAQAWIEFNKTQFGCWLDPKMEAQIISDILTELLKEQS